MGPDTTVIPPRSEQARRQACKLHSTSPIERLNGEIKRRTDMVGISLNEAAVVRLVDALLLAQSGGWATHSARAI
jgi:transposase-like protein